VIAFVKVLLRNCSCTSIAHND